jgi:CBS domain-containing protein
MDLNIPIANIMSTNVETVSPSQKLVDLKHIYESPIFHNHIPVTEDGKLVGMVSLIDFMRAVSYASLNDQEEVYQTKYVKEIMSINPYSTEDSTSIKEIAEKLALGDFHSVVLTNNGHLSGIITSTDLIRYMLK